MLVVAQPQGALMSQPQPDPLVPSEPLPDQVVPLLRSLGLTAIEAEIYFTALRTSAGEPFSSYKLAQTMGRDPANVGKVLGALVRLRAMTVVQDKPRLYLPADPAEFTERILTRLQQQGRRAVNLLQEVQAPRPETSTRSLAGPDQVFAKARELLAACQRLALVFGSKEALRELGAELEDLAASGRTVRVLSPLDMVTDHVQIAVYRDSAELAPLLEQDFLQLVVDDQAWLSAVLPDAEPITPCGWWSADSPIAGVMARVLTLAWPTARAAAPDVTLEAPAAIAAAAETAEDEAEELTFLIRHEQRESQEKGER
jgi:sugar-specific transcriptional regulator TrmB